MQHLKGITCLFASASQNLQACLTFELRFRAHVEILKMAIATIKCVIEIR